MATGNAAIDTALESATKFAGDMTTGTISAMQEIQLQHFKLQMATLESEVSKSTSDGMANTAR